MLKSVPGIPQEILGDLAVGEVCFQVSIEYFMQLAFSLGVTTNESDAGGFCLCLLSGFNLLSI